VPPHGLGMGGALAVAGWRAVKHRHLLHMRHMRHVRHLPIEGWIRFPSVQPSIGKCFRVPLPQSLAVVRVRADDESVARKIVPTVLGAPGTAEIRLANENNAATGCYAAVTDVDFSIGLVKPPEGWFVREIPKRDAQRAKESHQPDAAMICVQAGFR
jgi:hypothetical protein